MTHDEAYYEAEEKIEEALKSGATELDLSYMKLTELPEALGQLTQLQELNLSVNKLTALPESLGRFTQLQLLNLTSNQLTTLPESLHNLELEREWFKKASPYLKLLTGTLGMVLPVASSAVKLALDETAYKLIEEQLDFGKSIIDGALGETAKIGDFLGTADSTTLEHGVALRSDGSTLRELHALLKAKDPGFGGLVRVMNKRQEFLWVHEKFAGEY